MRQLREQHWPGLVTKYPHYLGPVPIVAAAPVDGSATATATTRSSELALPAFRDGVSQREGYGQAATVPWGIQGQDPMADWCGYCLSSGSHSTYTCTKLSRAFHQNAVRQDFMFPPGWAAIPPGELPQSYASSGYAPSGHPGYASLDYGTYRDDQRGRNPFRQSAFRSRSGDRYREYREDCGYYRDDSGANQDKRRQRSRRHSMYADRRHRSRSRSAPLVDQGYAQQASTPQRSQSRSASRGST
ncbi:hypothetical protein DYB31_015079, partial [Aphanomyces astaci]